MIEWQAKKRWWPLLHRDVGTLIVLNDTVARLIVNRSPHFSRWENNYFTRRGRVVLIMHVEGVVGGWGSTRSFGRCRSRLEEGERTIGRELGDWSSFACWIGDFQMMHITWGCHMRTHMGQFLQGGKNGCFVSLFWFTENLRVAKPYKIKLIFQLILVDWLIVLPQ